MSKVGRIYRDEWTRFRSRYGKIFILLAGLFLLAAVLSHTYFMQRPQLAEQKLLEIAQRLLEKIPMDKGRLVLFIAIVFNNATAAGLAVLAGLIPVLFLPALAVVINGAVMGILSAMLTLRGAHLGSVLIFGLAPHGFFEIPAFLYAAALGIRLTSWLTRFISNELFGTGIQSPPAAAMTDSQGESFPVLLARTFRSWLLVVIPLLLIAALMEAFVTPVLIKTFIN
jgi:stage II sporulation protein M